VAELPGEPHADVPLVKEVIACIAHVTDLHVTDAQSPARFEFLNQFAGDPRFRELLTMQRPQEMLNTHAIDAMVRAINAVERGPVTRAPIDTVAVTGDLIDNTQRNELTNALALLNGGTVRPDSGAPGYDGVQREGWPGDIFWKPDGPPDGDFFQSALGFPRRPGLLEEAVQPFAADGLRSPWLACHGNHEYVCQGVGIVNERLVDAMTGTRKPVGLPAGIDPETAVDVFTHHPELFMTGESIEVAADGERRPIRRDELVSEPYYVRDTERVRFIVLDTVRYQGGADGAIDAAQLLWLDQRLSEAPGRRVVVMSHHPSWRIEGGAALVEMLARSPEVVLWLNGHVHVNRITSHGRFREVTTSSLVDWPCQGRIVELYETAGAGVAIATTMLDHDADGLAGLHSELAGNSYRYFGFDSGSDGAPADRNAAWCCA
jgi:3',5'-cyclic AMP phosphodiesterase CpdA